MCYINQHLPVTTVTSYKFPTNLEVLPIERIPGKRKILLLRLYRPPSYSENEFLFHFGKCLKSLHYYYQ